MPINYGRYYSENELKEKASEIINYYSINEQIKLDQKTTFSLFKHLFGALSYKLPDPLQFPENYNDNVFRTEEVIPISITEKNVKKKITKKTKVKKEDNNFWTRNCKNNILCKSKYIETVNEIIFMYNDIGPCVYSICNDNYDKYMSEIYFQSEKISNCDKYNQMPNILCKTAEFKIQCWLEADKIMKDHKFF